MATHLHNVVRNFRWRIAALSPTSTLTAAKFRSIDPLRVNPDETAGLERSFAVTWLEASGEVSPTDLYARDCDHIIEVALFYPVGVDGYGLDDAMDLICQDRHDIVKELRDPANHVGYDDDNTTTNIWLQNRVLESSRLDRGDTLWTLRLMYRCFVREVEQ